jgi:transcription elongation factor GreA
MQVPVRRSERYNKKPKLDPYLTKEKFIELENKLNRLKENHPRLAAEVKRLAEMGDFSENAGYQLAKGRLRGTNQRILDLEYQLKHSIIIEPDNNGLVQIGNKVILKNRDKEKSYLILGSTESDPTAGIISHNSPLGSALIGKRIGERVKIQLKDREIEYEIMDIK